MKSLCAFLFVWLLVLRTDALRFDEVPSLASRPVQDRQLQDFIKFSCRWLKFRAVYSDYALLNAYAEQLQLVLRTECAHCVDYYEAAGLMGLLGKTVSRIMNDARDDIHYPVVRRSYVAAVWLLQRSKQFVWETTHLPNSALTTMFRLYLGHVHRAKGRTVSLHHISKCGGTTMCQLAASNRCSNPHLSQEKNCVVNDRLDGPLWMVGHNVSPQGVVLNPAIGSLDVEAVKTPLFDGNRRFANEPKMDMWLMYACPYAPNGKTYNCPARAADAHESGTTFLANERTLTREAGVAQVCREFLNTVILREPIPHAISIMAEVKYRYVRQMAVKHNIHSWQPTAWNLTWWESLGPALVGNYATRTLLGRESLCRSASNMGDQQLADAIDSLLSFDMVMTLGRSQDIDLAITTLLGWPARNFSSQPGARVREVSIDLATKGQVVVGDSKASKAYMGTRHLLEDTSSSESTQQEVSKHGRALQVQQPTQVSIQTGLVNMPIRGISLGQPGGQGAAQQQAVSSTSMPGAAVPTIAGSSMQQNPGFGMAGLVPPAAAATNLTPQQLEEQAAVMLVTTTWYERQGELLGVRDRTGVEAITGTPQFAFTQQRCKHGSHLVNVTYHNRQGQQQMEVWHSFPRHTFAFLASDVERLEHLTRLDTEVYHTADLIFNLDTAWLQAMLSSPHFRKKLRGIAATQTSCGFAGMIPLDPLLLKDPITEA